MSDVIVRSSTKPPDANPETGTEPKRAQEFLGFSLADETFAFPLRAVKEILKMLPLTEVPRTPPEVLGIVSVRGRVTTVVDLALRLGFAPSPPTPLSRVLLVDRGEEIIGLLVDRVAQVYRFDIADLEYASSMGGDSPDHILGIGRPKPEGPAEENDIVVLLDPQALFKEL